MNSHELQQRIRRGDRDAFRELYAVCGQGVYVSAQEALGNTDAARDTVKQVFLNLHHEILNSDRPLDIDARLAALTEAEIRTRRILGGDFGAAEGAEAAPEAPPEPVSEPVAEPVPEPVSAPVTEPVSEPAAEPAPVPQDAPQAPPLERAQAYMEADGQKPPRRKKRDPRPERAAGTRGNAVITILIVIFLLLFLWVLVGILMDFEVLPRIDLGFRWFNESVFPLFNLES